MTTQYHPPHPGEFIKETYIEPLHISLRQAAQDLDVAPSTFSRLIKGKSDDVEGLKRIAVKEGLPYQTLISSILHKYVTQHLPA